MYNITILINIKYLIVQNIMLPYNDRLISRIFISFIYILYNVRNDGISTKVLFKAVIYST